MELIQTPEVIIDITQFTEEALEELSNGKGDDDDEQ